MEQAEAQGMDNTWTRNWRQTYTSETEGPCHSSPSPASGQRVWQTRRWQAQCGRRGIGGGGQGEGQGASCVASRSRPRGTLGGPGEKEGQGWTVGLWPKGRGQGLAGNARTLGEAPPLWGSLVLEPGEAGWLGPSTTHAPPHSYTSSTRALSPQHPPLLFGQVPGARPSPRPRQVETPTYIQRRLRHVGCSLRSGLTL